MTEAMQLRSQAKKAWHGGDAVAAQELMERAWQAAEAAGDHAICARVAHSAADLYQRLERPKETERYARQAIAHQRQTGEEDLFLGNCLLFLARLLADDERRAQALPLAEDGVRIFARILGRDHQETAMAKLLWARCQP